ncbi:uncharacterized protein METZ01_LOCUS287979 [marine metagenome]|uniref:Uncharacterized protein n=1 Tax=marine metagenome TaxID=408172 RepID=A0A382LGZ8_9ZZZZ
MLLIYIYDKTFEVLLLWLRKIALFKDHKK